MNKFYFLFLLSLSSRVLFSQCVVCVDQHIQVDTDPGGMTSSNTLVQSQMKDISFKLENSSSSSQDRSFKLFIVQNNNVIDVVWGDEITFLANQTRSFTKSITELNSCVFSTPGSYSLQLQAIAGLDTSKITYNTSNNISTRSITIERPSLSIRNNVQSLSLTRNSGSTSTFRVEANCKWEINNIPNWLDVSPKSGDGNESVTVESKSINSSSSSRSSSIQIKMDLCNTQNTASSETINITQAGSGGGGTTCSTPSVNSASNITSNSARISWSSVSGASNYDVEWKTGSQGWGSASSRTVSGTTYSLTGLSGSTKYDFRVRANCSGSSSNWDDDDFTTSSSGPSSAPTANFSYSPTSFTIGQNVDFSDQSSGGQASSWSWTFEDGNPSSSSSQNPSNVKFTSAGKKEVKLTALNSRGSDTETKDICVKPPKPNIGATISGDELVLSGFSNTYTYNVYRKEGSNSYKLAANGVMSYKETCLKASTVYYYKIVALKDNCASDFSNDQKVIVGSRQIKIGNLLFSGKNITGCSSVKISNPTGKYFGCDNILAFDNPITLDRKNETLSGTGGMKVTGIKDGSNYIDIPLIPSFVGNYSFDINTIGSKSVLSGGTLKYQSEFKELAKLPVRLDAIEVNCDDVTLSGELVLPPYLQYVNPNIDSVKLSIDKVRLSQINGLQYSVKLEVKDKVRLYNVLSINKMHFAYDTDDDMFEGGLDISLKYFGKGSSSAGIGLGLGFKEGNISKISGRFAPPVGIPTGFGPTIDEFRGKAENLDYHRTGKNLILGAGLDLSPAPGADVLAKIGLDGTIAFGESFVGQASADFMKFATADARFAIYTNSRFHTSFNTSFFKLIHLDGDFNMVPRTFIGYDYYGSFGGEVRLDLTKSELMQMIDNRILSEVFGQLYKNTNLSQITEPLAMARTWVVAPELAGRAEVTNRTLRKAVQWYNRIFFANLPNYISFHYNHSIGGYPQLSFSERGIHSTLSNKYQVLASNNSYMNGTGSHNYSTIIKNGKGYFSLNRSSSHIFIEVYGSNSIPDVTLVNSMQDTFLYDGNEQYLYTGSVEDQPVNARHIVLKNPMPGDFYLEFQNVDSFNVSRLNNRPFIEITKVTQNTSKNELTVDWRYTDVDDVPLIHFGLTQEEGKVIGMPLQDSVKADKGSITLDIGNVASGNWYLYAVALDGQMDFMKTVHPDPIEIIHKDFSAKPSNLSFNRNDSCITLNWTPLSGKYQYIIYYSNDTNGLSHHSPSFGANTDSSMWFCHLSPGQYYEFCVSAMDSNGNVSALSKPVSFYWKSNSHNNAPYFQAKPTGKIHKLGNTWNYQLRVKDEDNDPLKFNLKKAPSGMSVSSSGKLEWKPSRINQITHSVEVMVSDNKGGKDSISFQIDLLDSNLSGGILSFYRAMHVGYNDIANIYVSDADFASNPDKRDSVKVRVYSTSDRKGIDVYLTEVSNFERRFVGSVGFTTSNSGNSRIKVAKGDSVFAQYYDAFPGDTLEEFSYFTIMEANFEIFNDSSCSEDTFSLINRSTGDGLEYSWNLGDGNSSTERHPYHIYKVSRGNGFDSFKVRLTVTGKAGNSDYVEKYVHVARKPDASLGKDFEACANATLVAIPKGMNYSWSTSSIKDSINIDSSGTYWVDITSIMGCSYADTVHATIHELPTPNLGLDREACDSLSLHALDNNMNYQWNTGSTDNSISVSKSGTYTLTYIDSNGCSNADSVKVKIHQSPSVNLGSDITACDSTELTVKTTGLNYKWSTGDATRQLKVYNSNKYFVTASTNFGCSASDTISVEIKSSPSVQLPTHLDGCNELLLSPTVGNHQFKWSTGATSKSILVDTSGIYSLEVFHQNGCKTKVTSQVIIHPLPKVDLGLDREICNSQLLRTKLFGSDHLWSTGETTEKITITKSNKHFVLVEDENGCKNSDTVQLKVLPNPISQLPSSVISCGDTSISTGLFNTNLKWSTGDTTESLYVSNTGLYQVTATNSSGCSIKDSCLVTINQIPHVDLGENRMICLGDSLTVAENDANYMWNTGEQRQSVKPQASGVYSVNVATMAGCSSEDSVKITIEMPLITQFDITDTLVSFTDSTVLYTFQNNSKHQNQSFWRFGSDTSHEHSPKERFNVDSPYIVKLITSNNCFTDSASKIIHPILSDLEQKQAKSLFSVYPNPTSGIVNIQFPATYNDARISILNMQGQIVDVLRDGVIESEQVLSFNLDYLAKGYYYFLVVDNSSSYYQLVKFAIE